LPEEASTGLAPHRAAKLASVRRRRGLSPVVTSSVAAVWGAHALAGQESGRGGVGGERFQRGVQLGDLSGQRLVAAG
jgi:hypothetical protein